MSKTKTKKAEGDDVEPDQGGCGADQDDGQDNDQDYAKARLLPGETKNYTKIPNPVLAEIEAILHHLKAGLYVLLEVYIRRHMGRTNKGAFKVGVIEGLTITRVAEILGCGHTTATRIRAKVVRDLGGVMVGDGIFRFGAAVTEGGSPGSGHGPVIGPQSGPANGLPNPLKMEMIGEGSGPQDGHVRGLANGCPRGPLEGIKLAQAAAPRGPQEDQDVLQEDQDGRLSSSSSSPGGRTGGPAGSPEAQGTEGTPVDKDGDEVPIVEGEYSPNIERDIDLDVEGGVLPVEQKVNAPDGKEEAAPEIIVWFVSEWNSICAAHGCPGRTITKLTPADVTFFSAKPKVTLTLALFYLRRNKKFPKYPITFDTLRKDGKIEKYAELGAMDMAMDFSDKLDKGEPGTPAPVQAPQPGPGPAPRATAVAAAQDIPEELRSAWENILTFYPYDRIDLDQDTAAFLAGIETCTPEELAACARHHVDSKMEPRWVKGFPNFISTVLPILLRQLRAGTLKAPKVAVGGPAHRRESNIRAASQFLNAFAKPTQSKE